MTDTSLASAQSLRRFILRGFDIEPQRRNKAPELLTDYIPDWADNRAQSIVPKPRQGTGSQPHADTQFKTAREDLAIEPQTLVAVWCSSVGTTWTLELRKLDPTIKLGELVDWISSGIPTSQPQPDEALTHQMLANRALRLYPDSTASPCTRSRKTIGYVTRNP